VVDHEQAAEEIGRPDAFIEFNPSRRPDSPFAVKEGGTVASRQFRRVLRLAVCQFRHSTIASS
jgi:hypothetical protein